MVHYENIEKIFHFAHGCGYADDHFPDSMRRPHWP